MCIRDTGERKRESRKGFTKECISNTLIWINNLNPFWNSLLYWLPWASHLILPLLPYKLFSLPQLFFLPLFLKCRCFIRLYFTSQLPIFLFNSYSIPRIHLFVNRRLLNLCMRVYLVAQLCPILCYFMGYIPPGALQARILEWVAMPSSRGSSWPGIEPMPLYVPCIGRQVLYH